MARNNATSSNSNAPPVNNDSNRPIEESSPYYLHHSDNPGLILVSQPLTGDNYASWNRAMIIAFSVKNKLGFLDGSIAKPADGDALQGTWIRNNNMAISWILNSVSKEISASVIFYETAYEIWNDLKERFQQTNAPRIFELRRAIMDHNEFSGIFKFSSESWPEKVVSRRNSATSNFRYAKRMELTIEA